MIDVRSDTVTRPSPAMRAAIAAAEVGDDVLGDDPTVKRLEQRVCELLGMPAAVYVPSGTMANALAIRSVTEPGDELIIDETTHSYNYETGGPAALAGCSYRIFKAPRGVFGGAEVEASIRPSNIHFARSRMVIIENTNNRGGGAVWPIENVADVRAAADRHGLHLHMDGARVMNACVARQCKPTDYTRHVHSVSMCFSKGLGAPVGSALAGPDEFIARARRFRKMFGGAMRQAGILAAAALYALDHNIERLAEDHANARHFANAIAKLPGIQLDPATVETNIVIFGVAPSLGTSGEFADRLRQRGVWMLPEVGPRVRAVMHLDVTRAQVDEAIQIMADLCSGRA